MKRIHNKHPYPKISTENFKFPTKISALREKSQITDLHTSYQNKPKTKQQSKTQHIITCQTQTFYPIRNKLCLTNN